MNLLLALLLINGIWAQSITLFAHSLVDSSDVSLATIDVENKLIVIENEVSGEFCIGTKDIDDHSCFHYLDGELSNFGVELYLDKQGSVNSIALTSSGVKIIPFVEGVKPNLNPVSKKKTENAPKVEKIVKTVIVKDEDGNEVEKQIEEEVDNRSFIQKNWVYIVIPLVFFLLTGEQEKEKQS